jgi:hypothetical protein
MDEDYCDDYGNEYYPVAKTDADLRGVDSFFLDRKGLFYLVPYCNHSAFARTKGTDIDDLERQGWIHVSNHHYYTFRKPTNSQLKKLEKWADINQFDIGQIIKDIEYCVEERQQWEASRA